MLKKIGSFKKIKKKNRNDWAGEIGQCARPKTIMHKPACLGMFFQTSTYDASYAYNICLSLELALVVIKLWPKFLDFKNLNFIFFFNPET